MTTRLELTPQTRSATASLPHQKSCASGLYLFVAPQSTRLLLVRGLDTISWADGKWSAKTNNLACISLHFRELAYAHTPHIVLSGNGTLSWTNKFFTQKKLPPGTEISRRLGFIGDCLSFDYTELYEGTGARHTLQQRITGEPNLF